MTLGRRIRDYRRSQHQTQERFAEDLGVTRETVSRWETGREEPNLFFMRRLSKLLPPAAGVSLADALPADLQRADDGTVRGLIDFIDNLDGLATLLDAEFRVVRTTRRHQRLMGYDASDIYGQPSERYWSPDMARIIGEVGGLRGYRRSGIYCMDLALIRLPTNSYATNPNRLVTLGRTVAIGNPVDPHCHLTTLRVLDEGEERPHCVIKGFDGEIVLEAN
jgi:transcriptional regulator with XRE-family HTH domain